MYQRFLNNNDYLGIVTEEALAQLIRGNEDRLAQAEEAAEASIIEYLTDNYQIEKCLAVGKRLYPYNKQVTYPAGAHFTYESRIYTAIRPINGYKAPISSPYWEQCTSNEDLTDLVDATNEMTEKYVNGEWEDKSTKIAWPYSQTLDWSPEQIVKYANTYYKCLAYNGPAYNDIRIPGLNGWERVGDIQEWVGNVERELWTVVSFNGRFYTLASLDEIDLTISPDESDNWGLIGEYTPDYTFELSNHEYVVYYGEVFYPIINPNADELQVSFNIKLDDPRNGNIKKHMLRLAVYELHKLISPNNVSSARITDYETSIGWLRDASRLRINPNIPRRLDETNKPETEYAIATFMKDYDPNKNPWQV